MNPCSRMDTKIDKTIQLMKKSYDQPIIFHKLHMHLIFTLNKYNCITDTNDEWIKILVQSASSVQSPNQGLEMKLHRLIKKLRPPLENSSKLKLMTICYYLLSRPVKYINHIVLFDLVLHFLGINDYFDGVIIKIFKRICTAELYKLETNTKLTEDARIKMLEVVSKAPLSYANQIQALPLFISAKISPVALIFTGLDHSLLSFKYLENMLFYLKYCKYHENIKTVLHSHPDLENGIESMLDCNYIFETVDIAIPVEHFVVENREIFDLVRNAYAKSNNKQKFLEEMIGFVENLPNVNR